MGRKYIISIILILIVTRVFAYLFPNEMLYYQQPRVTLDLSENDYTLSLMSRVLTDTIWGVEVKDPVVTALMQTESSFIIHSISPSNAIGPFQMKPFLAQETGIHNPFNPYKNDDVMKLLNRYKKTLGNMDAALGAYHIGFYGTKKMVDSGQNPASDNRIKNYVNKIHGFQRLYSEGDWISLKDYLWFDLRYTTGCKNELSISAVIPEFFFGSIALKADYKALEELSVENFNFSVFQDFAFFWFMNLYIGYDQGLVSGITLKSNDWFDRITLKYDFNQEDLIWEGYNSFGLFCMNYGFSKDKIYFAPGMEFENRIKLSLKAEYDNFKFKPGIECVIKF